MRDTSHHPAEGCEFFGLDQRFLGLPQMPQGCLRCVAGVPNLPLSALAFGDLFSGDVDRNDLAAWRAQRMPICHPVPLLDLVGALAGYLDPDHRLAGFHDRTYDRFDGIRQRRHAIPDEAAKMIFHRNPANLGEAMVDLQIPAVGGQAGEPDRRGVIDQLQGGLLRKQYHLGSIR